ncbi:FAD-dependent monooxygenase [Nocardia sp. NPDC020380]|uniref:FAD-dependent monooxygenase n=1 Tax=Nocardia sp. NPDC020380 TaxID=3364309 RepID=UPI0037897E5E
MKSEERVPVLIVGGGLVGLSTALFLEYQDIPYVLVERRVTRSVLPRARGMHTRAAEMFRQVGLQGRIQEVAATVLKSGHFGGASRGRSVCEAAALDFGGRSAAAGKPGGPMGFTNDPSPANFVFVPQVLLEPVLEEAARERGGELRFGNELVQFASDDDGVTATLRDQDGMVSTLRADYLVAADGAGSPIRQALGITGWEVAPTRYYINVFARVDLTELLGGRSFSQCDIAGDGVRGVVLCKNNTDEWSFHIEYDPARETLADYPPERCVAVVRAMVGDPDIAVEVLAQSAWDTGSFVADEYRRGRAFLAGDAAHRHMPWGGFGGKWRAAAGKAGRDTGVEIAVHALPATDCADHLHLPDGGALLLRPDMHVAARSDEGLTPAWLDESLRLLTDSANAAAPQRFAAGSILD